MSTERDEFGEFFLSTSSESGKRAASVLPTSGSEDVSRLLGVIDVDSMEAEPCERDEYLPEAASEWVLDVAFLDDGPIDPKVLSEAFGESFRECFGRVSLYGKDFKTGFWTFLISSDGPEKVTGLKLAWRYYASRQRDPQVTSAIEFQKRIGAVSEALQPVVGEVKVIPALSAKDAAAKSSRLSKLSEKFDKRFAIYLDAPEPKLFEGRDIWDVMLCLGLQWGDMDCFHWINESEVGGDYFFSVESSTPPGYFIPEQIAADQTRTQGLIFLFNVPRTAFPTIVAERMDQAVRYAQSRLGGEIQYTLGQELADRDTILERIKSIESELTELGFQPGSSPAMRFF
ncbi:hypothetical protein LF1_06360 [Rubripirellula obstinata]|uniref:Cell division protein ZipA n=1 Tax=Rubripirellula obstinata TaxID=406547 RepID=A0A5B1CD08_9BACT|nr:cell division protein ZipA C-terminal FtsZ-binding domain-containing protein [Rubripirellula obstinata]KAA1258121.1 hypothetical protein LF1_06360 [Rubripirellula obstinata]